MNNPEMHNEEETMKLRLLGVLMLAGTLISGTTTPVWSADGQDQETAPAAVPSQSTAGKQQAEKSASMVKDAVVCQDVVDRNPVGSGDVFAKETAIIYCFCRVVGVEGEGSITHNWYHKGTLKASVTLPVRSINWRTWSAKSMSPEWTGEWMVEILSAEGTPLESIIFFIQ